MAFFFFEKKFKCNSAILGIISLKFDSAMWIVFAQSYDIADFVFNIYPSLSKVDREMFILGVYIFAIYGNM